MNQPVPKGAGVLRLLIPVLLSGCSGDNTVGTVHGEVRLDGRPLRQGIIRFVAVDGKSPTADAGITDGRFAATVPVGQMRVEITAPKVVGKQKMYDSPDSPSVDTVTNLIPPRYNVHSELKMAVGKASQEKTFELTSK
jgi:hypothetical protein